MKNKDTFELFEIFKPGVMDDMPFFKKLGYWFKNVYWYHYKMHTLIAAFAMIILAIFICDIVNRVDNDFDFIFVGESSIESQKMAELSEYFSAHIPDINDDGKITVGYQMLYTGQEGQYDELSVANQKKLAISFADDRYVLFIMDKDHMENFAAQGAFEPLKSFDIESENKFCVPVSQSTVFKKIGISSKDDDIWYIGLKVITKERAEDAQTMKKYHAAVELIEELLKKL